MKNIKKLAAVAIAAGGLAIAGAGVASAAGGATAQGGATGSPGVVSGNDIQVPISGPVDVCGNNVDAIELLDFDSAPNCGR
ncbi:chaplin [Streptomyces sp. P1-3]|uniref:chaplin n=1 Tax=Streptomyces sp. P1-3 TaxID=3421658 RepID=UPI003D36A148